MEKFNRAVRRHHIKRLKKQRLQYWFRNKKNHTERTLGIVVNTTTLCSGPCCGNSRKYMGQSIKEIGMFQTLLHCEPRETNK
jgi:hypothetical protein